MENCPDDGYGVFTIFVIGAIVGVMLYKFMWPHLVIAYKNWRNK